MAIYIYDGSFAGLICAVKTAAGDPEAEIRESAPDQESLFTPAVAVEASPADCAEFLRKLEALSGPQTPENIKLFWLWSGPDKERSALAYARMAFSGRALNGLTDDPVVARVRKGAAAVLRETQRLKGLLRFAELADGVLYAETAPDHDVLPLLAGHFKKRLAASNWVIHDVRRESAALYFGGRLRLAGLENGQAAPLSWRAFFNSIAVKERNNPRLQRANVPLKYRGSVTELE